MRGCGRNWSDVIARSTCDEAIQSFLRLNGLLRFARNDDPLGCLKIESERRGAAAFSLLPSWEKVARTKSVPDEGALQRREAATPHPSRIRCAHSSHLSRKGRGQDHPALAAFLRQARCTAQLQPGGCEATSSGEASLAGAAEIGATVGIASLTRRSCADWSCAGI
jgi:hypothetical protein